MIYDGTVSEIKVKVSMDTSDYKRGAREIKEETEDFIESTEEAGQATAETAGNFGLFKQISGTFSSNFKKSSKAIDGIGKSFMAAGGEAAGAGAAFATLGAIGAVAAVAVVAGLKKVYESMSELVSFASPDEYLEASTGLKQSVANFKQVLGTAITPIFQAMTGALKGMVETLTNVAFGLMQIVAFIDDLFGLGTAFNNLSTSIDGATAGMAAFDKVTTINDQDQYASDLKTVKEIGQRLEDAKKVASDVRVFFNDIGNALTGFSNDVQQWWNSLGGDITRTLGDWGTAFIDWWNSLGGIITGAVTNAFNGIKNAIEGILKGVVNVFIDSLNKIINLYNSTIGNFRVDNDLLNIHFGMPKMDNIPRLANGGVISANTPTLAIIGDNKRQKEAITPVDTLKGMIAEAVSSAGAGSRAQDITVPVSLELDGQTLARTTYRYNMTESNRRIDRLNGNRR